MAAKLKVEKELNVIRNEASKVIDDISQLGKRLAEAGVEKSKDVGEDVEEFLEKEVAGFRKRLKTLNAEVAQYSKAADEHVRANPYLYILGSLGVGFLLGKIVAPRLHE